MSRVRLRVLVHVGHQHSIGAERAGIARNENAADAEFGRDPSGDRRAHAAERHQRELARIVAALDRDRAHRAITLVASTRENAPRRLGRRHRRAARPRAFSTASRAFALAIGMAPSSSAVGIEVTEQRRARRSASARCRRGRSTPARARAGALRPDLEDAPELDRGDAAAAGADRLDVDRVGAHGMPGDRHLAT